MFGSVGLMATQAAGQASNISLMKPITFVEVNFLAIAPDVFRDHIARAAFLYVFILRPDAKW